MNQLIAYHLVGIDIFCDAFILNYNLVVVFIDF